MSLSGNSQVNQSPGPFLDRNQGKERSYVQFSHQQLDPHELRTLNPEKAQVRDSLPDIKGLVSRYLSHALPSHQELVTTALQHQLFLFAGTFPADEHPLWMKLVRRENGGLRQVSQEWVLASDNFIKRLGIAGSSLELVERTTKEAALAYRLGHHKFASQLATERNDISARTLLARIAVAAGTSDKSDFAQFDDDTAMSLQAAFLVQQARRGQSVDEELAARLEERSQVALNDEITDERLARISHVINSLNFVWLRQGKLDRVGTAIEHISSTICPQIADPALRNHIFGNSFFHRAILARSKGDSDAELSHLQKAADFDYGFTDYDYRMAQVLHDRRDQEAKNHYEAAIKTSPFNLATVNDYGVFLNDFGMADELRSWETVATFLFANGEAEGNA